MSYSASTGVVRLVRSRIRRDEPITAARVSVTATASSQTPATWPIFGRMCARRCPLTMS